MSDRFVQPLDGIKKVRNAMQLTVFLSKQRPQTRREKKEGREYIVVPVVALVEGVVHASNATDPEFVPGETLSEFLEEWTGKPLFWEHPQVDGEYVSGADAPDIAIGFIDLPRVEDDTKLLMDAWLDEAKAPRDLLAALAAGDDVEVSVGVLVATTEEEGQHNGKSYKRRWSKAIPDHLAILPKTQRGACNFEMGCGLRAASSQEEDMQVYREISTEERQKMPEEDFAGPHRSFPIKRPADVAAAAHSLGRAKGDRDAIKANIIKIAYRKGEEFVAKLPDEWKRDLAFSPDQARDKSGMWSSGGGSSRTKREKQRKDRNRKQREKYRDRQIEPPASDHMGNYSVHRIDTSEGGVFATFMASLRAAQKAASDMTDNDLRAALDKALRELPQYQAAPYGVMVHDHDEDLVIYMASGHESGYNYYQRSYTLNADGTVSLGDDEKAVEPVMYWEPVDEGGEPEHLAARNAGCGCQDHQTPTKEATMACKTKVAEFLAKAKERISGTPEAAAKFLESLTDEQFASIEKLADPVVETKEVEKIVEKPVEVKVEVPAKPATLAAAVALVPEADQAPFKAFLAAQAEKKTATIKVLKESGRCAFTDEQLNAKDQAELDSLVALAGGQKVDFSGAGAPRHGNDTDIPATPSISETFRAARQSKK